MNAECFPYCCLVLARLPWPGGWAQLVLCGLGPLTMGQIIKWLVKQQHIVLLFSNHNSLCGIQEP